MLFIIFVLVTIIGIAIFCFIDDNNDIGFAFGALGAIAVFVSVIIIAINSANVKSVTVQLQVDYQKLILDISNSKEVETDMEIFTRVASYNTEISEGKKSQRDFMVGIYVPDMYDQFKLINYGTLTPEE